MTKFSGERDVTGTNTGCALQYGDLRDWLAAVEAKGDLNVVTGANWHTDIGQVVEVMCHDEGTPSVLFDEVEGSPKGFRLLEFGSTPRLHSLKCCITLTSWRV